MKLLKLEPLTDEYLESIGFVWHTDEDNSSYIANEVVQVSEMQANAYYEACNESVHDNRAVRAPSLVREQILSMLLQGHRHIV